MNTHEITAIARAIERILIVGVGALSIYFGYRLFDRALGESGELIAKLQKFSLKLQRVGPGIFFSLFGTFILSLAIMHSMEIILPASNQKADGSSNNTIAGSIKTKYATDSPYYTEKSKCKTLFLAYNTIKYFHRNKYFCPNIENDDYNLLTASIDNIIEHQNDIINNLYQDKGVIIWFLNARDSIAKNPKYLESNLSEKEKLRYEEIKSFLDKKYE